ncbi:MAG: class I SAM-dependent methyltransferase [bacterium]|nr:class I SAM-dependent methyltransferase [bacterium]
MADLHFNKSYTGRRSDLINLIAREKGIRNILDVGCSTGVLGGQLKSAGQVYVAGLEKDRRMAQQAGKILDKVVCCDVEKADLSRSFSKQYFDLIILGDVLEHFTDPWGMVKKLSHFLKPGRFMAASIPNIRYYTTFLHLLFKASWPYRERGIYDRTHLRFFTYRNMRELFESNGFSLVRRIKKFRFIESPHPINHLASVLKFVPFNDIFTFQYLLLYRRVKA